MGVITFNGISSTDFGLEVSRFPDVFTPEREYQVIHVPGRNGDLLIDTGSYKNVPQKYSISIPAYEKNLADVIEKVNRWLHSANGYARLEDSYTPQFFRMAYYKDANQITNYLNEVGVAEITFDCKPQRFLKSGERSTTFSQAGSITNLTNSVAKPLIIVSIRYDSGGTLHLGNETITIKTINRSRGAEIVKVTIDTELGEAYSGTTNQNGNVMFSNLGTAPSLKPGKTAVSFSGGISMVEIIPRWWTV